ncbi:MAG: hypothetical protein KJZ96_04340 [Rhodocyclaceae bacterium]|nr:hypothetical protein [Rhodocyclaceae bacterium]
MRVVFVHGWSVTHTDTYGELPEALAQSAAALGLDLDIRHLWLGRYVSFHDEVTLDDIARGFDRALRELHANPDGGIAPFSCITHSTGGPVVRHWLDRYYGAGGMAGLPLSHLVMLAPANHGSSLAVLGKARVGRLKAWFDGVEPGQRVLDWLCLGSAGQWQLNRNGLELDGPGHGFYPFVLTGQGIDEKFYDFLNNYLKEPGSDGVVRVSGANLNYRFFSLHQGKRILRKAPLTFALEADPVRLAPPAPLRVYEGYSHSGTRKGIMASIRAAAGLGQPVVQDILDCLRVASAQQYEHLRTAFAALTNVTQSEASRKDPRRGRFSMLVFRVRDDRGNLFARDDFEILLLSGRNYQPGAMPDGFLRDRQINPATNNLVFYLDYEKIAQIADGQFGIRVVARPASGFASYRPAEYRSEGARLTDILAPNETTYVDICLTRNVDANTFRFDRGDAPRTSFKHIRPSE